MTNIYLRCHGLGDHFRHRDGYCMPTMQVVVPVRRRGTMAHMRREGFTSQGVLLPHVRYHRLPQFCRTDFALFAVNLLPQVLQTMIDGAVGHGCRKCLQVLYRYEYCSVFHDLLVVERQCS